jgi:hypothetical protein
MFLGSETAPGGLREYQRQHSVFGVYESSLSLLKDILPRSDSEGGQLIADVDDDLVDIYLAERACLSQPGFQVFPDPRDLAVGFPVLAQYSICHPNGGRIALNVASNRHIFYEEPPAGLH